MNNNTPNLTQNLIKGNYRLSKILKNLKFVQENIDVLETF
jgi:hypothetical protein